MIRISAIVLAASLATILATPISLADTGATPETSADTTPIDPIAYALPADKNEIVELEWADLLPPGEDERIAALYQAQMQSMFSNGPVAEGSADDIAVQIGTFNTVSVLDGHKIRIPGYTVPFEFGKNAKITEFLLVPYYGACLHAPPPPPNQTIYVTTDKPLKLRDLAQAVWIEGYVRTQTAHNDLGDAAYTLSLTDIEVFK